MNFGEMGELRNRRTAVFFDHFVEEGASEREASLTVIAMFPPWELFVARLRSLGQYDRAAKRMVKEIRQVSRALARDHKAIRRAGGSFERLAEQDLLCLQTYLELADRTGGMAGEFLASWAQMGLDGHTQGEATTSDGHESGA